MAPWDWTKEERYAFDHTTHESVRKAVLNKGPYRAYVEPKFPEEDEDKPGKAPKNEEAPTDSKSAKSTTKNSKKSKGKGKELTVKDPSKELTKGSQIQNPDEEWVGANVKTTGEEEEAASSKTRKPLPKRPRKQDSDDESDGVVEEPKPKRRKGRANSDEASQGAASTIMSKPKLVERSKRKKAAS